jgi:hypothetical protein
MDCWGLPYGETAHMKRSWLLAVAMFGFAASLHAQPWSGVLSPSRAINWSGAGVDGGIPSANWIQCGSTINAGASATTINNAIDACGANQYVRLGPGTFNLSSGLDLKSNMALRGAGANQTILNFTGTTACAGAHSAVCIAGGDSSDYFGSSKMNPGGSNAAMWTSGYAQGATQIILNNIGSNGITVGKYIYLDQDEDTATTSGFFVCENTSATPKCSLEGGGGNPGREINGVARQQIQIVKVTACSPSCTNGSTFTISPGLHAPNWSASKNPGAWWPSASIVNAGLEDVSVNATNSGGNTNIGVYNARNVWVKGTRQIRSCSCSRSIIQLHAVARATVQDNYIYGTSGQSQNYGVESYIVSDSLILNNIFQHTVSPMMLHSNQGSVYAYNFVINNTYDDGGSPQYHYMANAIAGHSAGVMYNLFEGNVGPGLGGDVFHGNQVMNTVFRNYWLGTDPGRIHATSALRLESWNRYWNVVGNVLGTPGYHTVYEASSDTAVYVLGEGRQSVPDDSLVVTTMMRWGNYDVVTGGVRWNASEVPSGISSFANTVPATQLLAASFYFSARPLWWPTGKGWPAIGPDVTNGNISGLGGRAHTIPAQDCYLNVMGGPSNGSGSVLAFNASTCYTTSSPPSAPLAPSNLRIER